MVQQSSLPSLHIQVLLKHDFHLNEILLREILPLLRMRCTATSTTTTSSWEGARNPKTISLLEHLAREHPSFSSRFLPNLIAVLYWKEFLRREDSLKMKEHCEAEIMSKVRNGHCSCLILLEGMKILGRSSPLFSSKNGRKFFFATHLGCAPAYICRSRIL